MYLNINTLLVFIQFYKKIRKLPTSVRKNKLYNDIIDTKTNEYLIYLVGLILTSVKETKDYYLIYTL